MMTLNLWNDERWKQREESVRQCLQTLRPDVLCVQELRASTREKLDRFLPGYSRVEDEFEGWARQSNVYWRDNLFQEVDHGAADVDISETRRLFWARLSLKSDPEKTILVSTAHLTYSRNRVERETGKSPRIEETDRTVDALNDIGHDEEPLLFMGDLNDAIHPHAILSDAGYTDCFSELNLPVRPTYPARPTRPSGNGVIERPLDWIFANDRVRCLSATVPHFYFDDFAPSDHWPVLAVYELND